MLGFEANGEDYDYQVQVHSCSSALLHFQKHADIISESTKTAFTHSCVKTPEKGGLSRINDIGNT